MLKLHYEGFEFLSFWKFLIISDIILGKIVTATENGPFSVQKSREYLKNQLIDWNILDDLKIISLHNFESSVFLKSLNEKVQKRLERTSTLFSAGMGKNICIKIWPNSTKRTSRFVKGNFFDQADSLKLKILNFWSDFWESYFFYRSFPIHVFIKAKFRRISVLNSNSPFCWENHNNDS